MQKIRRALLIRLDKIGDLILTLPVDQSLSEIKIDWWIPKGLSFIARASVPRRSAREVSRKIEFKEFLEIYKAVRRENYDLAVVFHSPWWVGFLLWLARIPIRVGVRSQWHSFLFYNRGVRQKRSRAEHSELEYNYRLLEEGLNLPIASLQRYHLTLQPELSSQEQTDLLNTFELQQHSYSVVHAGMAGSALNWPTENYSHFIKAIAQRNVVVMTGTPADEPFLHPLRESLAGVSGVVWLDGKLSGPELIAVLANAKQVLAPSTGVMHLAASVGRPTLGIFSPVRVQQPRRWGPQGPRTATLMPNVECPGELNCLGDECRFYPCMNSISPESALQALDKL